MGVQQDNTSSTLLHTCMTKATTAEGDQMRHGPNWVLSRRARLKIFDDHLACGDWTIDYGDIQSTTLFSIRSNFIIPGYVLRVETEAKAFHFGLNPGRFWKGDLPFPVSREKGKLGYSVFSLLVRLLLVGYLTYRLILWVTTR